jgi:protein ImuB
MLGHGGVGTAIPTGGRMPADRQQKVAWGDRAVPARDPRRPWPGAVPPPHPATVYEIPREIRVEDHRGRPVSVTERGSLSASPAVLVSPTGSRRDLTAWAGPWPLEERWWDPQAARVAQRFQVVDATGEAWLLVLDARGWWAHGRYD